jgi:hypothetical protein
MPKVTFLEFTRALRGYDFFSKRTGYQVYKYQMYWNNLTPMECFDKFDSKIIINEMSNE